MLNFRVCFSSFIALTFSMCRGLELLQKGQMRSQKGTVIWEKGGPENWWRMWAMAINLGNSSFFGFCAGFTFRRIAWEPLLHVWLIVFPQFWIPVNLSFSPSQVAGIQSWLLTTQCPWARWHSEGFCADLRHFFLRDWKSSLSDSEVITIVRLSVASLHREEMLTQTSKRNDLQVDPRLRQRPWQAWSERPGWPGCKVMDRCTWHLRGATVVTTATITTEEEEEEEEEEEHIITAASKNKSPTHDDNRNKRNNSTSKNHKQFSLLGWHC